MFVTFVLDHPSAPGIPAAARGNIPSCASMRSVSGEMTWRSKSWLSRNGFPHCHEQHKDELGTCRAPLGLKLCVHHEVETSLGHASPACG